MNVTHEESHDGGLLFPVVYREDFESGELNGWASYPPCQDTAYNPFVYPGKIRHDDPGISFVATEEVHWREDQFLGGIKLLDLVLDRSFSLTFRYYIKSLSPAESLDIHFPLATGERLVYTLKKPPANRWFGVAIGWRELEKHNRILLKRDKVVITALALKVRISKADPDFDVFFAFDDVELKAIAYARFSFTAPVVLTLSEWPEHIVANHFTPGDTLTIEGHFPYEARKVSLHITPFAVRDRIIYSSELSNDGCCWKSPAISLETPSFPPGMYRGVIAVETGDDTPPETPFTFLVVDRSRFERHPRVLYAPDDRERIRSRFNSPRFAPVRETFVKEAVAYREKVPADRIAYDFDQFPVKDWIASLWRWFIDRIMNFREALYTNAVVYAMCGDETAGDYCRRVLLALAGFPSWNHPWMENRGLHSYFPMAEMTEAYAFAYDTVYDRLSVKERVLVRTAMVDRFIRPTFRTWIEQNRVTVNSSNWISHINGGALLSFAAMYGEMPEDVNPEPWLSGFILKEYKYMTTVFGEDGSYGEGFRYYNFAMHSFARVLPMLDRLFGVDMTPILMDSFKETLWAGIPQDDILFTFGDSEGYIRGEAQAYWIGGQSGPMNNWAWLVARGRNPYLSWLYHTLKQYDTFEEVINEVDDVPATPPSDLPPVAFFRQVGTAVFKSGWASGDFVFVFRSGPFYNHQHMDQGSFFLTDHGKIFIEERYDGDHHYYDDPLYQSHAIRTISHNTILIDGNPQSQETGDPVKFAVGMSDSARFASWFDSELFSFVTGELEGVYSGAAKEIRRHVLYIKPRTVLLVDRIVPDGKDVLVSSLFHTRRKEDIEIGKGHTVFHRDDAALFLYHLVPVDASREIKRDPHFLSQFGERPLVERGYLEVSAKTSVIPLVMAHLLTATADGLPPKVETIQGNGWTGAKITVDGIDTRVCVNTAGDTVDCGEYKTDALIMAHSPGGGVFIAHGSYIVRGTDIILSSQSPVTVYIGSGENMATLDYHCAEDTELSFAAAFEPARILFDGKTETAFKYDRTTSLVTISLSAGEGHLTVLDNRSD